MTALKTAVPASPVRNAPREEEIPIVRAQKTKPKSLGSLVLVRIRQIERAPRASREKSGLF